MLLRRLAGIQGMTFGIIDGVITVLGVLAGLYVLGDRTVVIAGMLIAGMADSLANAVGIHVSQETEGEHGQKEVMMSTLMAFLGTFAVTLALVLPHALLGLHPASVVSITMGLAMILGVGYFVGKKLGKSSRTTCMIMAEYLTMAVIVIVFSYMIGFVVRDLLGVAHA